MPIDMHSHWYPESLVEALRRLVSAAQLVGGREGRAEFDRYGLHRSANGR
jgi:hypothetical protein